MAQGDQADASPQSERFLPLTTAAMVLVAFAAFGMSGGGALLLLFSGALLASYGTTWRLNKSSAGVWILRTLLYGSVMFMVITDQELLRTSMQITLYIHVIGLLMAAELVLQCWQDPPVTKPRSAGAVMLSGIVFVAASKTFDERLISWFTPPYVLLVIVVLRNFRPRRAPPNSIARMAGGGRGVAALALAMLIGFSSAGVIWQNRSQITNWFMQLLIQYRPQESTGMARTPHLGRVFDLRQSAQRVLRLEGADGVLYLHGMAFDFYHNGEWGPDLEQRSFEHIPLPEVTTPPPGARKIHATRLVDDFRIIFVPLHAASLEMAPGMGLEWAREHGGPLRTQRWWDPPFDYTFTMTGVPNFQGPFCPPLFRSSVSELLPSLLPRSRPSYLHVPREIDPRVRDLAQSIAGNLPNARAKIDAICAYLMSHHTYSLSVDPGKGDPVSNFVLKDLSAHCEYFASSATIMLRCVGVPTRYVTGYMAHELQGKGVTIVRQRDAHAWAESWVDGSGWVTVEATPGNGRPDEMTDDDLPWTTRWWEKIQDFGAAVKAWLGERSPAELLGLVGALGMVFAGIQVWRQWRAKHPRKPPLPAYHAADRRLQALAADFSLELMRRGYRCGLDRTWQELLEGAGRGQPESLARLRSFVALYNHLRFGPQEYEKEALLRLQSLLTELQAEPQAAAAPAIPRNPS